MKVQYTSASGRLTFDFEANSHKDVMTKLAAIQELFEESSCGMCKSANIRFEVREHEGNSYYKILCGDCGATLDYGQHKTGNSLFVKRWDKDTKANLPNRGWYQYRKQSG
jgi:hypothetical protein